MIIKKLLFLFVLSLFSCESSILEDPETKIEYSLSERSHVKITVENSYGTLISTLIDEEVSSGSLSVDFDASNLAEGVYFYTIESTGVISKTYFKSTKILLLVK